MYNFNPSSTLTMEAIAHQKRQELRKDLIEEIKNIKSKGNVKPTTITKSKLGKIIQKHTNMKISVTSMDDGVKYNAYVYPPDIDKNNIVINEWRRKFFKNKDAFSKMSLSQVDLQGTMDLNTSKVSGFFSEIEMTMVIGTGFFETDSPITESEVAAIIGHETGHCWSYMECLSRAVRSNMAVEYVAQRIKSGTNHVERVKLLSDVENLLHVEFDDKERIAKVEDPKSYQMVILNQHVTTMRDELGSDYYGDTTFEQMSDQFSARHGMAVDVATGLDKLYRMGYSSSYVSKPVHWLVQISKIMALAVVAGTVPVVAVLLLMSNPSRDEYDKPKARFLRLKREAIDGLKDQSMPAHLKKRYVKDVEIIEDLVKEMEDKDTFYQWVWDNVLPNGRKQANTMKIQQTIEVLVHNDLFLISGKFGAQA